MKTQCDFIIFVWQVFLMIMYFKEHIVC